MTVKAAMVKGDDGEGCEVKAAMVKSIDECRERLTLVRT
jgi:hypothetical protein